MVRFFTPSDPGVVNLSVILGGTFTTNYIELQGAKFAMFRFWGISNGGTFAANPTVNGIMTSRDDSFLLTGSGGGAEMGATYSGLVQAATLSAPTNARALTVPLLARGTILSVFPWWKYGLTVTCSTQAFTGVYGDAVAYFDWS